MARFVAGLSLLHCSSFPSHAFTSDSPTASSENRAFPQLLMEGTVITALRAHSAKRSLLLIATLTLILASQMNGQGPPPPQRDASAIATISAAIAALGGQTAVSQINDSVATGTTTPQGQGSQSGTFTWKTLGAEFRYETQIGSSAQIYVSGYGSPANSQNGTVASLPVHVALASPAFHLPALLLSRELNDSTYTLIAMGNTTLPNGQPVVQVRTISAAYPQYPPVTQQDWFFDPATNLPLRVAFSLPTTTSATDCTNSTADFAGYQDVSGILVPLMLVMTPEGSPSTTVSISTINFNVGLLSSDFTLGGGEQ